MNVRRFKPVALLDGRVFVRGARVPGVDARLRVLVFASGRVRCGYFDSSGSWRSLYDPLVTQPRAWHATPTTPEAVSA